MKNTVSKRAIRIGVWLGSLSLVALALSSTSFGQNVLYHLLAVGGNLAVNFNPTSQSVNESTGVYADWSSTYAAWTKRRRVVLQGTNSSLTNYTILLKLDATKIDYTAAGAAGVSLRFADNSGAALSYEIESWNPAGTSNVWVKIPTLAAYPTRTTIWMYYGNAAATDGQTPATTWATSFQKVQHFNGTTGAAIANGATLTSSVGASMTATNGGAGMSYAAGPVGTGVVIDGTDDWFAVGADAGLSIGANSPFTVGMSFKTAEVDGPLLSFRDSGGGQILLDIVVGYNGVGPNNGKINVIIRGVAGGTYATIVGPTVNDGQWHDFALTRDAGSNVTLYVDGVSVGTASTTGSGGALTADLRGIGSERYWVQSAFGTNDVRFLSGTLDEFRFSNAQLSADWIALDHATIQNPAITFFGEETPTTTGVATVLAQMSSAAPSTVTVPYTVSGTATSGTDFSPLSGTVTIAAGSASAPIGIRVLRDTLSESNETVILTMGTPTGAALGPNNVHTLTIVDDPPAPPVAVNDTVNLTNTNLVNIDVLANDTDANNDMLTITAMTAPLYGTAVRVGQAILYTPSGDFGASDSFNYTISDGNGGSSTATVTINYNIPFVWTGASDANWANAANWYGGAVPGVSDTATFNNSCSANCNPSITGAVSIGGLRINSSYTGTIAQPAGQSFSVGSGHYLQRGGTFTGSNSAIGVTGNFTISGGTFTSTSGMLTLQQNVAVTGTPTFNANSGTVKFLCAYNVTCSISPGAFAFNHVIFTGSYTNFDLAGSTITVNGNIALGDTYGVGYESQPINNGTLKVAGNVTVQDRGFKGTAVIELVGNAAGQTVTGLTGRYIPGLKISAGSNPVTLVGEVGVASGSYTYVSASSVTTTGSTLNLYCGYALTCAIVPGAVDYNNVIFAGFYTTFNLGAGTMKVLGNLTLGDTYGSGYNSQPINNGTFNVSGSVVVNNQGYRGTAVINAIGGSNTNFGVATSAGTPTGLFTVNKTATANKMTLASNSTLLTAGQNMTVTTGTVDLAGYMLTIPGTITVGANGKILCNGGTLTAGSAVITGEVSCGTSIGITWTGAAGDGLWSTAGNWTNNTVPGASDIAYFNGICGANCNATFNANLSVKGVVMTSAYTGTLTQPAGLTMTVGTSGWSQAGGTFAGGDSTITMNGPFALSGGSFTATSGTFNFASTSYAVTGTSTFAANSGLLQMQQIGSVAFTPGSSNYNNVTLGGSNLTINLTGTLTVLGSLTISDATSAGLINTGTIVAKGDVAISSNGKGGTALLKIAGAANQAFSAPAGGAKIPNLEIASTGGTVSLSGQYWIPGNYTHTSGTVNVGTSTFVFMPNSATITITPNSIPLNNVTFQGVSAIYNIVSTLTVNGTLNVNESASNGVINTGPIHAKGNVSINANGAGGTAKLIINGSSNQTITGAGGKIFDTEIASTGGTVSLSGTLLFTQNYKYTSGVVDAGTSTLSFSPNSTTISITAGSPSYYNVQVDGYVSTINLADTMEVLGTLTIKGSSSSPMAIINGGTLLARKDVSLNVIGLIGTTLVKVAGSTNQTLTGLGGRLPNFEIASTGGTVTISGTFTPTNNFTYTSGTVDATTSTFTMVPPGNGTTITPGTMPFYNLTFAGYNVTHTLSGTATVLGTLNFASTSGSPAATLSGGAFDVKGNVTLSVNGYNGTAPITMSGSSSSNLSMSPGISRLSGSYIVDKSGGASVKLMADTLMSAASQALTINNGVLDLNSYAVTVNSALTIGAGGTLRCNGGTYTSGSFSNSGTLNCPGQPGYEYNWTGAGADSNWSTAANWQGGVAPTATSVLSFDNAYCGANCNAAISANANVRGVIMQSGYASTITQASGATLTLGASGWKQYAGTFAGSNASVTSTGSIAISGGSYTATSATTTVSGNWSITGAPTVNMNSGTLAINSNSDVKTVTPGSVTYSTVQFTGSGSSASVDLGGATMNVAGPLTFNHTALLGVNNGTISAKGNVNYTSNGRSNLAVVLSGNTNQTVTVSSGSYIGMLEVASTGGTVSMIGTLSINWGFKYTSGTINWGTSILSFNAGTSTAQSITPGAINYQTVEFIGSGSGSSFNLNGGTMTVVGPLTISHSTANGMQNGTIAAKGDVTLASSTMLGTALLQIAGSTNQSVSAAVGAQIPAFEFASTGGTVTMSGLLNLYKYYKYTSGTINWGATTIQITTATSAPVSLTPGAITYPATTFTGGGSLSGFDLNGGTMIFGGTLTLNDTAVTGIANGTLEARGNFVMTNHYTTPGNASIKFSGSATQTISRAAGTWPTGTITVAKSGGSITQTSAVTITGASALNITSGSWFMSGYALTVPGLSLNSNTLTKGTGVLTVNGTTAGTGSLYGGTVAP